MEDDPGELTQEEAYKRFTLKRVARIGRGHNMSEDASVYEVVSSLGSTPEEVVATLRSERCYGPPMNDCFCPVAQYIARKTGKAASATPTVCVIGEFTFLDGDIDTFIGREWARTTSAVSEVITAIDHGLYSDLNDLSEPEEGLYGTKRTD